MNVKIFSPSARLILICKEKRLSQTEFLRKIGSNHNTIQNLKKGLTQNISVKLANQIVEIFPEYSHAWLLTGEGNRYNEQNRENTISNNTNESGVMINHIGNGDIFDPANIDLLSLVVSQQDTIKEQTEQIKKLIDLIAKS